MDLLSTLVRKAGVTAGVPPRLVGRWFVALAHGRLHHHTIRDEPASSGEMPVALVFHYLIGITLAFVFGALVSILPAKPHPLVGCALALVFGVATNVLPWLLMFPSMGFGAFGRAGPSELMLLRTSFVNHVLFGAGLAVSSLALGMFATGR